MTSRRDLSSSGDLEVSGRGQRSVSAPLPGEADSGAPGGDAAVPSPAHPHVPHAAGADRLRPLQLPRRLHHVPDPVKLGVRLAEHRQLADSALAGTEQGLVEVIWSMPSGLKLIGFGRLMTFCDVRFYDDWGFEVSQ